MFTEMIVTWRIEGSRMVEDKGDALDKRQGNTQKWKLFVEMKVGFGCKIHAEIDS